MRQPLVVLCSASCFDLFGDCRVLGWVGDYTCLDFYVCCLPLPGFSLEAPGTGRDAFCGGEKQSISSLGLMHGSSCRRLDQQQRLRKICSPVRRPESYQGLCQGSPHFLLPHEVWFFFSEHSSLMTSAVASS